MADPLVTEPPPESLSDFSLSDLSAEFNNLPIPSMDSLFFADNNDAVPSRTFASDLELGMEFGEIGDFEITFDDLDNLYIPSDAEDFLFPDGHDPAEGLVLPSGSAMDHPIEVHDDGSNHMDHNVSSSEAPESGTSAVSGSRSSDAAKLLNSQLFDSASCKRERSLPVSLVYSGEHNSHNLDYVKFSGFESPESDSCERESSGGPVSSQGSGNARSGVYEVMNSASPDRGISSHALINQDIKLEEMGKTCELKRKKEPNEGNAESRTAKYRKSSVSLENSTKQSGLSGINDEDEKRKARLTRNRESAQLSRQRKKHYVEELEEKVRSMHSTITELSSRISFVVAENTTLRQQLSASGMCPTPPPVMYHPPTMASMPYPWMPMPCAPYVMKPQGSQVPLVPIPRLKSQQPVSASKTRKSESKRTEGKTKKVASISLLGLFFFILLFGGLVPLVNVKFGGVLDDVSSRPTYVSDRLYDKHTGKVWHLYGHTNGSDLDKRLGLSSGRFGSDRINFEIGRKLEETHKQRDPRLRSGSDDFVHLDNSSEPLLASLYVPRNDKMVKIDGKLIIHSILAGEKAVASQTAHTNKDKRETGLAISKDLDSALAISEFGGSRGRHPQLCRSPPEQRKALASGSAETLKDHLESTATNGKMQQWFREGLAGPMLSSGMCTEVFQFDASPTPGAIVPASSVANFSSENHQNGASFNKSRNRRILHKLPGSLAGSGLNISQDRVVRKSQNDNYHGNKSVSSMVVSVLVDPKEAGDDVDGMIAPKSLSRIFVVVLVDSVKYVTYSCGLTGASPHLVAA